MASSQGKQQGSDSGSTPSGLDKDKLLDAAIVEFLRACEAGRPPEMSEFLERYSPVASDLREFLGQQKQFQRMMSPVRQFNELMQPEKQSDLPQDFGDYELIREIGRGGMGVIYEAHQKGLKRKVALKMIRESRFATADDLTRFQAEAEASAALEHPNIVPIYRVGVVDGRPFFTMKLVDGGNLKEALQEGPLQPTVAAEIALAISKAVFWAHQRMILHRDLKPANILLDTKHDLNSSDSDNSNSNNSDFAHKTNPVSDSETAIVTRVTQSSTQPSDTPAAPVSIKPMISDFGLAKRLDQDHGLTMTGAVLGTPSFMSPEQARGDNVLTTATDVYGVGAIIYNMLTGQPPFIGATPIEITRSVLEKRPDSIRSSNRAVDLDLETICLKCLEKEPQHRYATAGELANDLQRYLNGETIQARRIGSFEAAIKWAKRNRMMAGLLTAIAALVLVGFVGSIIFSIRFNDESQKRGEALVELRIQEIETAKQRDQALHSLFKAKFSEVAARTASGEVSQRFKAIAAAEQAVEMIPNIDVTEDEIFELRTLLVGCLDLADVEEANAWETTQPGVHGALTFNADLSLFAQQVGKGPVHVYETDSLLKSGSVEQTSPKVSLDLQGEIIGGPNRLKFSKSGKYLSVVTYDENNELTLTLFDALTARKLFRKTGVCFASMGQAEGKDILATAGGGKIIVYELPTLNEMVSMSDPMPATRFQMEISPDGSMVARYGDGISVFDLDSGKQVWRVPDLNCFDLAWHPERNEVVVGHTTTCQIWRVGDTVATKVFPDHTHEVYQVEFSPDGEVVLSSTWNDTTRFWDVQSGDELFTLPGYVDRFSEDGTKIGFSDSKAGIRKLKNQRVRRTISKADSPDIASKAMDLAIHPNQRLAALGEMKDVRLLDIQTGKQLVDLPGGHYVRFHPDGSCFYVYGSSGLTKWPLEFREESGSGKDSEYGKLKLTVGPPERRLLDRTITPSMFTSIDVDPDGKFLAIAERGMVHLFDLSNPSSKPVKFRTGGNSTNISLSAGASMFALGNHHGKTAEVFDGRTGQRLHKIETLTHARVKLNSDGSLLALTYSNRAEVFETKTWTKLYSYGDDNYKFAWPAAFSPTGNYLMLTAKEPRGTLFVEAKTGRKLILIPGESGTAPRDAAPLLSQTGKLITIKKGNAVEAWDIEKVHQQLRDVNLGWDAGTTLERKLNSTSDSNNQFVSKANDTSKKRDQIGDAKVYVPDTRAYEVEVLWGEAKEHVFLREMNRLAHRDGWKAARSSLESWIRFSPQDPALWQAGGMFNRAIFETDEAIRCYSNAIETASDQPIADFFRTRALLSQRHNRRQTIISDLKRYLELVSEPKVGSRQVWHAKRLLAWELALHNSSTRDAKLAMRLMTEVEFLTSANDLIGVLGKKTPVRVSKSDKIILKRTLGATLYRNQKYEDAIAELTKIVPSNKGIDFDDAAEGTEFILAMCHKKLGRDAEAKKFYQDELDSHLKYKATANYRAESIALACDWDLLKQEAEQVLEINTNTGTERYWSAFDLAPLVQAAAGNISVQYFGKHKRILDPPQFEGETTKNQDATELAGIEPVKNAVDAKPNVPFLLTNTQTSNLFWQPLRPNASLDLTIEFEEAGRYDGFLGMCRSHDYGQLEFTLNGKPVGKRFEGFNKNVVLGDGIEFKNLKMRKGSNVIGIHMIGNSKWAGNKYYAGIEYLKLNRQPD